MADREKLVNIIDTACEGYAENLMQPYGAEVLADYLIANGVRISPWISVKDRLPEDQRSVLTLNGHGKIKIMCLWSKRGELWTWIYQERFVHYNDITHWMPLPEPPKED